MSAKTGFPSVYIRRLIRLCKHQGDVGNSMSANNRFSPLLYILCLMRLCKHQGDFEIESGAVGA